MSEGSKVERPVTYPDAYPIDRSSWSILESKYPQWIEIIGVIPVGFVTRKNYTGGPIDRHRSLLLVIRARYGLREERVSTANLGRELGVSSGAVINLTLATIAYLADETQLPLLPNRPQSSGFEWKYNQTKRAVDDFKTLKARLEDPAVSDLDRAAVESYLKGQTSEETAGDINNTFNLPNPIDSHQVLAIIKKQRRLANYRYPALFSQKSLTARRFLVDYAKGQLHNPKAQATEAVLRLLDDGYSRAEILDELGILMHSYTSLVREAFYDLESDKQLNQELADIRRVVGKRVRPDSGMGKNQVARHLIQPYRSYRLRLGERLLETGGLTSSTLSPREKWLLEKTAEGYNQVKLAALHQEHFGFWVPRSHLAAAIDLVLGEVNFITQEGRQKERQELLAKLKRDLENPDSLPSSVRSIRGFPTLKVLTLLTSESSTYNTVIEEARAEGVNINKANLIRFYATLRAYYDNH